MTRFTKRLAYLCIALTALSGCGKSGPTTGEISSADYAAAPNNSVSPPPEVRFRAEATQEVRDAAAAPESESVVAKSIAPGKGQGPGQGGDRFSQIIENEFVHVGDQPLSTFSVDVDTASYAKARMYLRNHGTLPPRDSIRIEEFVNYFDYQYEPPTDGKPFSLHVETASAPWRGEHRLVRVGLQGKKVDNERPHANLVFLVDVSGSMDYPNKLPLVKSGLTKLLNHLTKRDRVAIVVYAGAAGLVLPSTAADQRAEIERAIEKLHGGGSTNGGAGIQLAYQVARENHIPGGVNRVLLCSDGDFNVGTTGTGDLVRLAEEQSRSGIYLSVLGYGIGNHDDDLLEQLSNKANGNYAFIDSERESHKVLCEQLNSTLVTIANDVKIQIEFNPNQVDSYRLIGYENRLLANQDFNDDKKDAGEIGAGHTVTAFYEIIPKGQGTEAPQVDPLRYQPATSPAAEAPQNVRQELLTVKVRYKKELGDESELIVQHANDAGSQFHQASNEFQFAASVAAFAMHLRESPHRGDVTLDAVHEIAKSSLGQDPHLYRAEFLRLVDAARRIQQGENPVGAWQPMLPSVVHQNQQSNTRAFTLAAGLVLALLIAGLTWAVGCVCLLAYLTARRSKRPAAFAPAWGQPKKM